MSAATVFYAHSPGDAQAIWPASLDVPEHGQTARDGAAALAKGTRTVRARGGPLGAIRTYTRRASGAYVERGQDERIGLHLRLGG